MAKDKDLFELQGEIVDVLPSQTYKVRLENEMLVTCYTSGKMRQNKILLILGDQVRVEMSPYDLTKGRIVYREK